MTDALFIVSEDGYWGEECVEPLTALTDVSVTVDGDLVTARGPESSAAAARTLLDELAVDV